MNAMHVYITLDDFDAYIKNKLSPEDLSEYQDCTFVPLKLEFNAETDMSIDAFIVPVKNGDINSCDNDRHSIAYFEQNKVEDNGFGFNVYTGKPFLINPVTCEHDWELSHVIPDPILMKDEYCYACKICGLRKREIR